MYSLVLLLAGMLLSEEPETLNSAVVSAERGITVSRSDTLKISGFQSITDLLVQSPGLIPADYGGLAGLKTVNLRGLGSPHTIIYIDGIKAGNVQSGQPDLGMIGLENFGAARIDYAQNSINFSTSRPSFGERPVSGRLSLAGGSFGTWLPVGRMDFRLSDQVAMSVNAAGVLSRGDFPYGESGLRRENNDLKEVRGGVDFFGSLKGGEWGAKAFYNAADRGTPGSVDWPSTDRQSDRNSFIQGFFRKAFTPIYSLNLAGKAASDDVEYISTWGNSSYYATELQLNSAQKFRIGERLTLSAVLELQQDWLHSTLYDASRTALTAIAGAAFHSGRLKADLTLGYEGTFDRRSAASGTPDETPRWNVLSPALSLRLAASERLDFVGFARRAFRTPTFNELYYPGFGNPELRPEDAWLTDVGVDYRRALGPCWSLRAKVDGFYNYLTDKIISAPSAADPSIWLPYNIGEVRSAGFDADAAVRFARGDWKAGASARYSFQDAENVPFLSKTTVVLAADAAWRGWGLDAAWNFRGGRFDSAGPMPDWNTLDLSASKAVKLPSGRAAASHGNSRDSRPSRSSSGSPSSTCPSLTFRLSARNLTDCRYELVSGYPMQGRSILASLEFRF